MQSYTPIQTTVQMPALLTQDELSRYLNKSEKWPEAARFRGTGPRFIKVGRSVRYKASDVIEWIESQARNSTAEGN